MNRILKLLSAVFLSLALATSCSDSDDSGMEDGGETCLVEFSSACVDLDSPVTRATSPLAQGSAVAVAAYAVTGETESSSCAQVKAFTVSDGAGTLAPADGNAMSLFLNREYRFYAFSPGLSFNSGSTKTMSIEQGVDFKITTVSATMTAASQTVPLPAMARKCSYVLFSVNRDASNTVVTTISVGENGFTMEGITHSPVNYTLGDGDIPLSGAALDGVCNIPGSGFTTMSAGNTYTGGALVLPKVDGSFTMSFDVYLNGLRKTATANVPHMPFSPGVYYTLSVNFWDTRATLTLTVANWTTAGSSGNVGEGGGSVDIGQWTTDEESGELGSGSGGIGTGNWSPGDPVSDEVGTGNYGEVTIGQWDLETGIASGDMGLDQSPEILVGEWTITQSESGDMGTDRSPTLSVDSWTANPSFSDELGANLASIGITGWTQASAGSTDMGEDE